MDVAARLRLATRETGAELRSVGGDSLATGLACVALLFACSGEPAPPAAPATPVAKQAVVVIEPPKLRVGDVAVIEVAVVTPPGHRVHPVKPPPSVSGLWLLDAEALPPYVDGARQVQRTRIRVRAREAGSHEWPAQRVEIEDANGAREELVAEARPFEVVSVLPNFSERVEPFSYRMPSAQRDAVAPLWAAAAGSLATFALLGAFALVRRTRRRTRERNAAAARIAASRPWIEALAALDAARATRDWRDAGGIGARALRRYVARRFDVAVESLTIEEFAAIAQPFGVGSRWPAALECLRDFDSERFRAQTDANAEAQVRAALDAAQRFVEASIPADAR
jgi:hypothetical protein